MQKHSMWWFFLLLFGLMIGGIQSLGWWTRPASAHSQVAPSPGGAACTTAAVRHQNCAPKHWRSMLMQQ